MGGGSEVPLHHKRGLHGSCNTEEGGAQEFVKNGRWGEGSYLRAIVDMGR